GGEGQLAFAQREAVVVGDAAVEHQHDRGVEGVGAAGCGARCRKRRGGRRGIGLDRIGGERFERFVGAGLVRDDGLRGRRRRASGGKLGAQGLDFGFQRLQARFQSGDPVGGGRDLLGGGEDGSGGQRGQQGQGRKGL